MTFRGMAVPQDVFRDFCDPTGHLPKDKVADAVRCLGENPLQSEIRDITNKFKGQGLNFQQFEEVVRICKNMNQSPTDELSESLAVFDVDGEGLIPRSQIKHLICSGESGEGLSVEGFEMLMEHIKANEDGMVRIADLVHLLEQK
eukprot:TRINITY_DN6346_c0_g1_i1.p1 TRINITY_DN6346_c0_g1~~TRINITY_DN6346_c0_g1_i1.p1  ORF type:complete len:145 (+),score=36.63 TRINITY_DN6346_c0_g1_i1:212-646(+)